MWSSQRHWVPPCCCSANSYSSLQLISWYRNNTGCWANRFEAKAARGLGKERWKRKQYAANGTGQKVCLFVTPTVCKSHQCKHQAKEIFHSPDSPNQRRDRAKKPSKKSTIKNLCLFKARGAFPFLPHKNWETDAKQRHFYVTALLKKAGPGSRHIHLLQRLLLRITTKAFCCT